jgi:hypothetical protein
MIVGGIEKGKTYYLMPNVLETVQEIWKLLSILIMLTNSDANIVGTNGPKAGIQVWQKKINHRLTNVKLD